MGVSVLGTITKGQGNGTTALSHTVPSGTDVLYLLIVNRYNAVNIADVQWNGAAMTVALQIGTTEFRVGCTIWRLVNPTPATGNFTWTNPSNRRYFMAGVNLDGVDTTTPEEDTDTKAPSSNGTSSSLTLTSQAGGLVLDCCGAIEDGVDADWTIGADQSDLYGIYDLANNPDTIGASSYQAGAASVEMSHSWTVSNYYAHAAIAVKPAVSLDQVDPDADVTTTGWTTAPLFSKVNDDSDATVIQATAV